MSFSRLMQPVLVQAPFQGGHDDQQCRVVHSENAFCIISCKTKESGISQLFNVLAHN